MVYICTQYAIHAGTDMNFRINTLHGIPSLLYDKRVKYIFQCFVKESLDLFLAYSNCIMITFTFYKNMFAAFKRFFNCRSCCIVAERDCLVVLSSHPLTMHSCCLHLKFSPLVPSTLAILPTHTCNVCPLLPDYLTPLPLLLIWSPHNSRSLSLSVFIFILYLAYWSTISARNDKCLR